jgi:hypothetical protein
MNNDPDDPAGGAPNRFIRFEDMDPEEAGRMRDMIARAEKAPVPASVQARRERNKLQPVRYGLSDQPLPGGAVAAVLREPEPEPMRLVVISRRADDRALFMGDIALDRDEDAVAEPRGSRLILVAADGTVVTQTSAGSHPAQLDVSIPDSCSRELIAPFLRAAEATPPVFVPGIGSVRIPAQ